MEKSKNYAELLDKLEYDTKDGYFYWKEKPCFAVDAWERAGSFGNKGYRVISYKGQTYKEHLLVWYMLTGSLPDDQIDHINRDKADNHMENLRDVSNFTNSLNRPVKGSSKYRGVYFCKTTGKYSAEAYLCGKKKRLGRFESELEAHQAWLEATVIKRNISQGMYEPQFVSLETLEKTYGKA